MTRHQQPRSRHLSNHLPGLSRPITTIGLALIAVFTLSACAGLSTESNAGEYEFENRLDIPPMLEPDQRADGTKVFDLTFTEGDSELLPGTRTTTWGLNQSYLAPTLRAKRGDDVVVNVRNDLDETTTLHWHGMHLPARMDGGPHQMIGPGETWSPEWTIDQPAASLWFHPHLHGVTADHVYKGAAGMFIVDDPDLNEQSLPNDYGVDDIPLIVQDKQFNADGSLDFSDRPMSNMGILGDEILVNSTHAPKFEASTSLVRFRVLNASNARVYNFGFDDDRTFSVIGSDTGLLEAPVTVQRLQLSPGERAEIVVEVEPEDDVMLHSFSPDLEMDPWSERTSGGSDRFDILRITAGSDVAQSPALPEQLVEVVRLAEADAVTTRELALNGTSRINDQEMDMTRIDNVVEVNTTEIWEVSNSSGNFHNFHIHLVHFQILDIDGSPPPRHMRGWKDTVAVPRGSTVRLIAEFKDYADPRVPYMYHCHVLRHEDDGMMGQFVVIEPGDDVPSAIDVEFDHDH